MEKYVYPIGSVVLLKNDRDEELKAMVAAYAIKDNKKGISYEYAGFELPMGYNPDRICFFNSQSIICPIFIGNIDSKNKKIRKEVSKHYAEDNITFLPIGSIVEINDGERVMITGICLIDVEDGKMFDYVAQGCVNKLPYKFNRDEIKEIIFVGYQGNEFRKYKAILDSISIGVNKEEDAINKIRELLKKEEKNNA